jgi:outer membrane protein OmpA-like peptidoglycan-associated protein
MSMDRTGFRIALAAGALGGLVLAGCAATPVPRALVISQKCADLDFPVYFKRFSAKLTAPARAIIVDAGRQSQGCPVASVTVLGLSGGKDPHRRLLDLSSKRASVVAKALAQAGFPEPVFKVQAEAQGLTGEEAAREPLQRRAEVVIKFSR